MSRPHLIPLGKR